jgi:short-subunit dehydrogenase
MTKQGVPEVVVVTGASAGIGRSVVRSFARQGAHIGLIARGEDGLEAARKEVELLGGRALVLSADVADHDAIEKAATRVESELGPIDVWINNAMTSVFGPFSEIDASEYKRVTEVTYLGQVHGTMAALSRMKARDRGTIVLVGSALAYRGIPLQSAYCGAKHALHGFFESLRAELLHDESGVRITMVQLPGVNTTQFEWVRNKLPNEPRPLGKVFQPEVAAEAIVFAAHDRRREVCVAGPTVKAILGNKLVPAFVDRVLAREGFEGQQTDNPTAADRKDNLFEPVPGDHGFARPFDREAKTRSGQLLGDHASPGDRRLHRPRHRRSARAGGRTPSALTAVLFATGSTFRRRVR